MENTLTITAQQRELLAEILESVLSDLSYEIADTDSSSYKAQLKERRDAIKSLDAQLREQPR